MTIFVELGVRTHDLKQFRCIYELLTQKDYNFVKQNSVINLTGNKRVNTEQNEQKAQCNILGFENIFCW